MPPSDDSPVPDVLSGDADRAERLLAITLRLNRLRDPDALLNYIIETATDLLSCEAASILLYDESTDRLRFAAATGSNPESLDDIPVPLDDSIAGSIFTSNEPLIIDRTVDDERHFEDVGDEVGFETRSLVGVPMRIGTDPVGVLEGLNKNNGPFTDDDIGVLSILAAQAAVAIRNMRQVQALEEANDRLSHLETLKGNLLTLASHELRTPISKIKGYGELLEEETGADEAPHVATILEATDQVEEIVDTMAQMDALSSGSDVLSPCAVTAQSVVRSAWTETQSLAQEHDHEVAFEVPDTPVRLHADPARLRLVFSNLLSNAFTYTPEGGTVEVTVGAEEGEVWAAVADSGIGLPEGETDRIFEEFYQVEDALTRSHGGLGLGLTIARRLVELHGGQIWAESPGPGEGTTVHLRLPADSSATAPPSYE
jgi:signal transduction histidine kinase